MPPTWTLANNDDAVKDGWRLVTFWVDDPRDEKLMIERWMRQGRFQNDYDAFNHVLTEAESSNRLAQKAVLQLWASHVPDQADWLSLYAGEVENQRLVQANAQATNNVDSIFHQGCQVGLQTALNRLFAILSSELRDRLKVIYENRE